MNENTTQVLNKETISDLSFVRGQVRVLALVLGFMLRNGSFGSNAQVSEFFEAAREVVRGRHGNDKS